MHFDKKWFIILVSVLRLMFCGPVAVWAGGPVGSSFVIGDQPVDTVCPAAAHNAIWAEYFVVWQNDRPAHDDIYGQLLTRDGKLSGSWRAVSAGAGVERRYPDVTHNLNFNEYLVVWEQTDSTTGVSIIRGQRIRDNGERVGGEIVISDPGPRLAYRPKVAHAFSAGAYLVVWENHTLGGVASDIVGQLVSGDGSLLGGNFPVALGTWSYNMKQPDLAYNRARNEFLVVWQKEEKSTGRNDIHGRRVTGGGVPLLPESIEIARYPKSSTEPAVAAIPKPAGWGRYLVVWELRQGPSNRDIMARVVNGDGTMAPGAFVINDLGADEFHPAVAGDEQAGRFLVAWVLSTQSLFLSHAREVTLEGELVGEPPVLADIFAHRPAVSDGTGGDFLVVLDGQTFSSNLDIHGQLWGNRAYLPILPRGFR